MQAIDLRDPSACHATRVYLGGVYTSRDIYMHLYELDAGGIFGGADDKITTLRYGDIHVPISCTGTWAVRRTLSVDLADSRALRRDGTGADSDATVQEIKPVGGLVSVAVRRRPYSTRWSRRRRLGALRCGSADRSDPASI